MRVHWTKNAIKHLADIHTYISENSHIYATRMVDRLTKHSEQIAAFPRSGRMVPEFQAEDIREVIERPYRIIYRIKPEQIDVLAVIHGARQIDRHMIN
ncbi:MAG: type II toxin-antitoxin system RelE/ParE family toxin [Deltaproteobacteria bacterium]|nr:type II toxin-antitoxin system RelE/ParE family toxin [Deltaproteobacteria bacterium]